MRSIFFCAVAAGTSLLLLTSFFTGVVSLRRQRGLLLAPNDKHSTHHLRQKNLLTDPDTFKLEDRNSTILQRKLWKPDRLITIGDDGKPANSYPLFKCEGDW